MGLLSIIWIVIFLVLGFGLTFQMFDTINFWAWDNIFGILMIFVALFGIYCMTKDTSPFVMRMRSKLEPEKSKLKAKFKLNANKHSTGEKKESIKPHRPEPVKSFLEKPVSVSGSEKTPSAAPKLSGSRGSVQTKKAQETPEHSGATLHKPRREEPSESTDAVSGQPTASKKTPFAGVQSDIKKPILPRKGSPGNVSSKSTQPVDSSKDSASPVVAPENLGSKNYLENLEDILREVDGASGIGNMSDDKMTIDDINLEDLLK